MRRAHVGASGFCVIRLTMDLDEITKILELMREHELAEFELERDSMKLRLRKHGPACGHCVALRVSPGLIGNSRTSRSGPRGDPEGPVNGRSGPS